jgi:hypothetical protein
MMVLVIMGKGIVWIRWVLVLIRLVSRIDGDIEFIFYFIGWECGFVIYLLIYLLYLK